jgi:Metallo-peptidase family M12B Reprolysin-like
MALTVRQALACIGRPGEGRSVLRDLFGYSVVPKMLSVRDQLRALEGRHYHVNVIRVAPEDFPSWATHQICYSLQFTREVYAQVGIGIGRVEWHSVSREQAGDKAVIDSSGEASDLTADWTVPNDALDLFVVRTINGADGWSAVKGSCDKSSKGMTGSVVELYVSDDDYAGNGFAHEMGHYLGLDHIADTGNFIGGDGASDSWRGIKSSQGTTMKRHCLMKSGCG